MGYAKIQNRWCVAFHVEDKQPIQLVSASRKHRARAIQHFEALVTELIKVAETYTEDIDRALAEYVAPLSVDDFD